MSSRNSLSLWTSSLRPRNTNKLLVAIVKPHKPVASCTIARWLRETLRLAEIDASIFAGHSTRGASTSAAAGAGNTTADIMKAADRSTESVFRRHYYHPSHDVSFGRQFYPLHLPVRPNLDVWCVSGLVGNDMGSTSPGWSYKRHHWYVRLSPSEI